MSSSFERLFGPCSAGANHHPAASPAAGLSTEHYNWARDRTSPVRRAATHAPQNYPSDFSERARPYTNFSLSREAFKQIDIEGAYPSRRPILATSNTAMHMRTQRMVDPLQPQYYLPACSSGHRESASSSSRRPMSSSLDCSDIPGARPREARFISPERRLHSSMDFRDVSGTQPRPFSRTVDIRPVCSMDTTGIARASPWRRTQREVVSPGRGTLRCSDIQGAKPGPCRGSEGMPSTWGLGRSPLPSVPRLRFNAQARKTVYERPIQYALGED